VEIFYPKRKLVTMDDFVKEKVIENLLKDGRSAVLVADLAGHFVTYVVTKI